MDSVHAIVKAFLHVLLGVRIPLFRALIVSRKPYMKLTISRSTPIDQPETDINSDLKPCQL